MKKRNYYLFLVLFCSLLELFTTSLLAQTNKLSGIVVDINGSGIPGVTIYNINTEGGVITSSDGSYTIGDIEIGQMLIFSFIGYQNVEIEYKGQKTQNIVLREASQQLEDVVVVGYGTQKKETLTGALSQISSKQIESKPTASISNSLGGITPGIVSRQSSDEPGKDNATVFIRGMATLQGTEPLIMVDGIERSMDLISTQEIESITILKDASATAVYGVRGANGVILITTKRGEMGKPTVTFRTETAILQGMRFPDYINGFEFASLMNEATINTNGNTENLPWTNEELELFRDGSQPYKYPNVNWTDEVLKKNAYQTINNLSISGGNETVRYFMNVGYTLKTGLFQSDKTKSYKTNSMANRYNFRSNIDVNVTDYLSFELGLGGIVQDQTYPGIDSNSIFEAIRKNSPIAMPKENPDGTPGSAASSVQLNPWALTTQSGYKSVSRNTFQGTFNIKLDLSKIVTEGLSLNSKCSYDYAGGNTISREINYGMKRFIGYDEDDNAEYNIIRNETSMGYAVSQLASRSYYYDVSANYTRTFGENYISGMVLFNRRDNRNMSVADKILGLPYRYEGFAGRATYDYKHTYLTEVNFGYNGSENFEKGNRYGFFPSISVGYVISNEAFWKKFIPNTYLKIRGSYGIVGNDQTSGDRFLYLSAMSTSANGYYYGITQTQMSGLQESKIGANVTWEKAYKTDLGIDLLLFKEKFSITVDLFNEDRKDILIARKIIPTVTGVTLPTWSNLGEVNNKGFEFRSEYKGKTLSKLNYTLFTNLTYAHNKIIEDDTAIPMYEYQNSRGTQLGQSMGYIALGFFENNEEVESSPRQTFMTTVRPGDIKYKDVNDDGVIDAYDRVYIGYSRTPEIMYGFGLALNYSNFDMSVQFTGVARTSTFFNSEDMWPYSLEFPRYNISSEYYDNRWISSQDNSNAKYPSVINGPSPNNYVTSTMYMRDASYLRLKNAEIGYSFNSNACKRIGASEIRMFINGLNLLTFDKLKIVDPESDGGTGNYPMQRTINCGVQIKF